MFNRFWRAEQKVGPVNVWSNVNISTQVVPKASLIKRALSENGLHTPLSGPEGALKVML